MSIPKRIREWTLIASVTFGASLALALGAAIFAPQLAQLGLLSSVYFVVLVPLALGASAFLFGALRSEAKLDGHRYGVTLQLGGPVVIFTLIVAGAFFLARPDTTFQLLVRLHGPGGAADIVRSGTVTLDLDSDRRTRPIGANGEAYFTEIPSSIAAKRILVLAEAPGHGSATLPLDTIPRSHTLYVELIPELRKIAGFISDGAGDVVPGVVLTVPTSNLTTHSDEHGRFEFTLPANSAGTVLLQTRKPGYRPHSQYVTVGNTELSFSLEKS